MKKSLLGFLILFGAFTLTYGQYTSLNAHSHNDYEQKAPFVAAYEAQFGSIEADIWAVHGELFVAHNREDISADRSLDILYLQPIVALFNKNGGLAWKEFPGTFQLLIDLKTEVEPTLSLLVEKLKKYPTVFDPAVNKNAVRITITGNRPEPEKFKNYPDFIFFDGNLKKFYDKDQLKRVALFSENLVIFTKWRATAPIPVQEENKLRQVIDSVHSIHKTIRFWNAPDTETAWKTLISLKADFLNTDHIPELASFLKNIKN